MARYNEILVGRFNRALQKLLSMKGPASLITLSDELFPVHPFFNGVENRYLEGWDRFTVLFNVAAAAGFVSGGRLRNPAGSNVVAVIEKVAHSNGVAVIQKASEGPLGTDLASIGTGNRLDPRGRASSAIIVSFQNTTATIASPPAPGGDMQFIDTSGGNVIDQILTENQEIPLLPGEVFQVVGNTVNVPMQCGMIWRERLLEESERA